MHMIRQSLSRRAAFPCYRAAAHSAREFADSLYPPSSGRTSDRRNWSSSSQCYNSTDIRHSSASSTPPNVHWRKQVKQDKKEKRAEKKKKVGPPPEYELTVGIEVHAQLDTDTKLFSRASAAIDDAPNSNVALFDIAFPGSQPVFQQATLIPALRAAIAFDCDIQRTSYFDRKHYFYQDQPAGYQLTQYYEPYAKNGRVLLQKHDGIAKEDGDGVVVGIKQIQLEQDTAKSQELPPSTQLLDFNRVSRPLIEIITQPHIHTPAAAAACVRKIQAILQSVGAVTTGMEMGGLRADVNVSVRKLSDAGAHRYDGIEGLGQRTEIKNLSSIKAVEDAVTAERDRQIAVLKAGGTIEGETRGWTIGGTQTRKLRAKEGEVDYRYMPDPDLGPVIIGEHAIADTQSKLPQLPDSVLLELHGPDYGLSMDDAQALVALDDGERLEYYYQAVDALLTIEAETGGQPEAQKPSGSGKLMGNWVLHELGGLLTKSESPWDSERVPARSLAEIVHLLKHKKITNTTARSLLAIVFDGDKRPIAQIVKDENLLLQTLSREEYVALAEEIIRQNPETVSHIREKGQMNKIGWLVGQMLQIGDNNRVEPPKAKEILTELVLNEK